VHALLDHRIVRPIPILAAGEVLCACGEQNKGRETQRAIGWWIMIRINKAANYSIPEFLPAKMRFLGMEE
jgi:hypothetical protein